MKSAFLLLLLWLMACQIANAQLSVELRPFSANTYNETNPEMYFKLKLQDTIFQKHEGLGFKNFASVKFEVDGKGIISNIAFSTLTDTLLQPHITNVLLSTNRFWVIKQNGKLIKDKVTVILPILFTLRPHTIKRISTRINDFGESFQHTEYEATHLFRFDKTKENLLYERNPIKYFGIVLTPIEVRVPSDPDKDDY